MMTTAEKLTALRRAMVQRGLAAYLVPTDDFHASEYVGDYFKAREYLSGFTGSAGTLLILPSRALLWTDGRYFIQAAREIEGSGFRLLRSGEPGVPTLRDIVTELLRPGRDPRDELPPPLLRTDVLSMEDLKPGMELMGTVRNVIDFGAFIDIGVHQDGLVHISQISDRYIKHPSEVLKVGDIVKVWVLSVDTKKKRISLTMRARSAPRASGEGHVSEAES